MPTILRALVALGAALLALLAVTLLRRGKARESFLFTVYIIAAASFTTAFLLFPSAYTPEAFMVKQGIYDSLLFGMSLELAIRTFAAFRGIAAFVRSALGVAVAVSTGLIMLATPASADYNSFMRFQPGVSAAGIWCLAFVGLLIVWYQIPVPTFTRAIILGYVPYLMVFTVCLDLISRLGWGQVQNLGYLNAVAYDTVAGYWVYTASRKD